MNDFQVTVPLTWSAVIQSLTFESAQQPLNQRYRLLWLMSISSVGYSAESLISTVGYSADSSISAVGYSANFESSQSPTQRIYLGNYIIHKRYRLHRGMTIGTVGYSANFQSPQQPTALILNPRSSLQRGFIEIFEQLSENEREKKILLASKSGAYVEQIHEKNRDQKISRYCLFKVTSTQARHC